MKERPEGLGLGIWNVYYQLRSSSDPWLKFAQESRKDPSPSPPYKSTASCSISPRIEVQNLGAHRSTAGSTQRRYGVHTALSLVLKGKWEWQKGTQPFLMECKHLTAGQKFTLDFHICKEMYISYSADIYVYTLNFWMAIFNQRIKWSLISWYTLFPV